MVAWAGRLDPQFNIGGQILDEFTKAEEKKSKQKNIPL
jgi:hypothetical protein